MEQEAVVQEQSFLESQLVSLRTQISTLASDVGNQRAKVLQLFLFVSFNFKKYTSNVWMWTLLQVDVIQKNHDQSLSELKLIHAKMKECDTQISGSIADQENCLQKISDMKLDRKKLENEVFPLQFVCLEMHVLFLLRSPYLMTDVLVYLIALTLILK